MQLDHRCLRKCHHLKEFYYEPLHKTCNVQGTHEDEASFYHEDKICLGDYHVEDVQDYQEVSSKLGVMLEVDHV